MIREESSWEVKSPKLYPTLTGHIEADVVIIGAGIAGIFNAYILSKAGLKVVVLEKNEMILRNATLYTTAFITKIIDTSYAELAAIFGEERAKLLWQSGQDAIQMIADIIKTENIDCEFKFVPSYIYAQNDKQFKHVTEEFEAIKKSGFDATIQTKDSALGFAHSGFMEIPAQAVFHPIKFAQALANLAESAGARIFTDSEVVAIDGTTAKTKNSSVAAKDIVFATYSPFTNEGTRFKKAMYVSYVYELEIKKGSLSEGMYLDMNNPYHYFRIDSYNNFDRMIIGGEDHRKDIKISPAKNFNALSKYIRTILADTEYTITRMWSGPILESIDGLPLIGRIMPHTYVVTAFSGNGMTYSAISSLIVRDFILVKDNPASLYDPKRTPTLSQLSKKGSDYAHEFFGGAFKNFFSAKK